MSKNLILCPFSGGEESIGLSRSPRLFLDTLLKSTRSRLRVFDQLPQMNENARIESPESFSKEGLNFFRGLFSVAQDVAQKDSQNLFWGGDHSISLATIAGVKSRVPNTKVLWIDAHGDVNTPEVSLTKKLHGMPLAFLLGLAKNSHLDFVPCLNFDEVFYLGIQDLDPFEEKLIQERRLASISSAMFQDLTAQEVALSISRFCKDCPLHISLDIDCLNYTWAPSTGLKNQSGLSLRKLCHTLSILRETVPFTSLDLVEVNPSLGTQSEVLQTHLSALELLRAVYPDYLKDPLQALGDPSKLLSPLAC